MCNSEYGRLFARIFLNLSSYTGPKNWHKHYPDCKKNNQSPIDIPTSDTEFEQARLGLTGYSQIPKYVDFTLINNGHTAQVTLENVDPYATFASVFGRKFELILVV